MEAQIKELLLANSNEIFGQLIPEKLIQFQKTRKDVEGDLTLVVFPFVKMLRTKPQEVGEKIGAFVCEKIEAIDSYNLVGGFLNFSLGHEYYWSALNELVQKGTYGIHPKQSKSQLMVEFSSPNTNKPLHLGHLRNIFLGHSVSRILEAVGHDVIKTQIINDRGIHICKSMLAWQKFAPTDAKGERETPKSTNMKGDKFVGKYYVIFDQKLREEAASLLAEWAKGDFDGLDRDTRAEVEKLLKAKAGKTSEESKGIDAKLLEHAKPLTDLMQEAKEMLVKWEAKDPQTYLLWSTMNSWVYEGFDVTYKNMGTEFDKLYYESDTFIIGKDLVLQGLKSGLFFKKEDGSIWVDLTDEGLDEKLLLRSDGTAVYMTQDMGTAQVRFEDFPKLDGITYTVGNEQDYHFKVLFLILQKLGFDWAKNCQHLSYGMVDLPTGKMKSREGTVVDADDLIDEVVSKAKAATMDRGHIEGMTENEVDALCHQIGLGGLKYYLLKVDPKKRMLFNPEESIELNGNTGPFIQYTHARIQSILRKESVEKMDQLPTDLLENERELIKQLQLMPEVIDEAAAAQSPALIANATYELVKEFNAFYQNVPIFKEDDSAKKVARLLVCKAVGNTIKTNMYLLGIEVPNRM